MQKKNFLKKCICIFAHMTVFMGIYALIAHIQRHAYAEQTTLSLRQGTYSSFFGISPAAIPVVSTHRTRGGANSSVPSLCKPPTKSYDCEKPTLQECERMDFYCACPTHIEKGGVCKKMLMEKAEKYRKDLKPESRVVPTCAPENCAKSTVPTDRTHPIPIHQGDIVSISREVVSNRPVKSRSSNVEHPWQKAIRATQTLRMSTIAGRSRSGISRTANVDHSINSCEKYVTDKYDSYLGWEAKVKELQRDPRQIYELAQQKEWAQRIQGPIRSVQGDRMQVPTAFGAGSEFKPINFNEIRENATEYKNTFVGLLPAAISRNKYGSHPNYVGFEYPKIEPQWVDPQGQSLRPVDIPIGFHRLPNPRLFIGTRRDSVPYQRLAYYNWNKHVELNNQLKTNYTDEELEIRYRKQMQLKEQVDLRQDVLYSYYQSTKYCFEGRGWLYSPDPTTQKAADALRELIAARENLDTVKKNIEATALKNKKERAAEEAGRECSKRYARSRAIMDPDKKKDNGADGAPPRPSISNCEKLSIKSEEIQKQTSIDKETLDSILNAPQGEYRKAQQQFNTATDKVKTAAAAAEAQYNKQEEAKRVACKNLGYAGLMKRKNSSVGKSSLSIPASTKGRVRPAGQTLWSDENINAPPVPESDLTPQNLEMIKPVRESIVRKLIAYDQQIAEIFKHGVELGCFARGVTPCDWSPSRFAEWIKDYRRNLVAAREQDFARCRKLTTIVKKQTGPEQWAFPSRYKTWAPRDWAQYIQSPTQFESYLTKGENRDKEIIDKAKKVAKHLKAYDPENGDRTLGYEPRRDASTGNNRFGIGYNLGGGWKVWNYGTSQEPNPCASKASVGVDFNVYANIFAIRMDFLDAETRITNDAQTTKLDIRLNVLNVDMGNMGRTIGKLIENVQKITEQEIERKRLELERQAYLENGIGSLKQQEWTRLVHNELKQAIESLLKKVIDPPISQQIPLTFHIAKDPSSSSELAKMTQEFMIGPIPAYLTAGAAAGFGIQMELDSALERGEDACSGAQIKQPIKVSTRVAPYASADAFLALGVGIRGVAEIGLKGSLQLIGIKVPFVGSLGLEQEGTPHIKANTSLDFELSSLSGSFSVYVKLLWGFADYDWTLFSWSGWSSTTNLFNAEWSADLQACSQANEMLKKGELYL